MLSADNEQAVLGPLLAGIGLKVLGLGRAVPGEPVPNSRLEELVATTDEWIASRTGIKTRYFCKDESNLDLAAGAAAEALERAGIEPEQLGLAIVASFTPDMMSPSLACRLHGRLGLAEDVPVFDINAACAGFLYGLQTARQMLLGAARPYALVVGSETISRALDFADRSTCVLFGDGAAAAVIELRPRSFFYTCCGTRADTQGLLGCGGLLEQERRPLVHMQGQEVFRFAVEIIPHCIDGLLAQAGLTLADIDYVVCHQANRRIISHVVKKLKARPEQFFINVQRYANTSSASVPLALYDMREQGLLARGQKIICVAFGAGFTWSSCLLEW